jgi:putative redox protein
MTIETRPRLFFANDITGSISANRQQVGVQWRAGEFVVDEPVFNGGADLGPDPFTLVLAGLLGCTLTTMRMYIRRKGWDVHDIRASVNMMQQTDPFKTIVVRKIVIGDPLSAEQKQRLLYIAKNCPVAKWLEGEVVIDTALETQRPA